MAIITGTNGDDKYPYGTELRGTNLADQIYGLAGDDALVGFDGNDLLEGGAGAEHRQPPDPRRRHVGIAQRAQGEAAHHQTDDGGRHEQQHVTKGTNCPAGHGGPSGYGPVTWPTPPPPPTPSSPRTGPRT